MKTNRTRAQQSARVLDSKQMGVDARPPKDEVAMKARSFGDFVAAVYGACGKRRATKMVQLAVNAHVVVFQGNRRFVVS